MKPYFCLIAVSATLLAVMACTPQSEKSCNDFPEIAEAHETGWFPLAADTPARIILDQNDYPVVRIASGMLADDVERITGMRPETAG